jgi:hypothetical protein
MRIALATIFALLCRPAVVAAPYTFTAKGNTSLESFTSGPQPKLNNHGTVYLGTGLYDNGINDDGTRMFANSNRLVTRTVDGTVTTMATLSQFPNIPSASLGADGSVVFWSVTDSFDPTKPSGIYWSDGVNITTIADSSGPFYGFQRYGACPPTINSHGVIAFEASLDTSPTYSIGVYISSGGTIQTLYDTSGPFSEFVGGADINDGGEVAFLAILDDGTGGIFRGTGGSYTMVAHAFNGGSNVSINSRGDVAFTSSNFIYNNSLHVVTADMTDHLVIAAGDPLFGSTVKGISFVTSGQLNDNGQVVFQYSLNDGRYGIALATPAPEPSSLLIATIGFAGFAVCGFQRRTH